MYHFHKTKVIVCDTLSLECLTSHPSKYNNVRFGLSYCVFYVLRLTIFSEESVPLFGPPLPSPPVFSDHAEFRDFLLVKCKYIVNNL